MEEDVMETAEMVDTTARVVELYKSGSGTRTISEQTGVPRSTIRRVLQRAGVYQGSTKRSQQPVTEQPIPIVEVGGPVAIADDDPGGSPYDLTTWSLREATVKRDGAGSWIIQLSGLYADLACSLPSSCRGRTIRWSANFGLINPQVGSCELSISDTVGTDSIVCLLQRQPLPTLPGSRWHIVRDVSGPAPVLRIRGCQHNAQLFKLSDIASNLR
jgi:hypothetical protein